MLNERVAQRDPGPDGTALVVSLLPFSQAAMQQGMSIEQPEKKPAFPYRDHWGFRGMMPTATTSKPLASNLTSPGIPVAEIVALPRSVNPASTAKLRLNSLLVTEASSP